MKTQIIPIVLALALCGCADTYKHVDRILNPPKFDSNEYGALVDVRQLAEKGPACEDTREQILLVQQLQQKVDWAKKYSEFLPHNDDSFNMLSAFSVEVDKFAVQVKDGSSPVFCKDSLDNINAQAVQIQKALGSK